jgi:hypothetical protein
MKPFVISGITLLAVLMVSGLLLVGCSLYRPTSRVRAPRVETSATATAVKLAAESPTAHVGGNQPAVTRVAGDLQAKSSFGNDEYSSGRCRSTTPLPEGYPAPTPPGAIELKRYPLVRRAEIGGTMMPDWGMNFAFFPLFNHIKRREIAMTSPVEMNYEGLGAHGAEKPKSWTMSFLYRTQDLGPDGVDSKDDRILIEDIPPMTVLAIGMRGPYKLKRVNQGLAELRTWLSQQTEWEEAGDPRALFYNGPEMGAQDKWSEVQIPLRRK